MFLRSLIQRLSEQRVNYCIVGGVAANLHGIPRMTYDIDLVLELTESNLGKAEVVFESLGLKVQRPVTLVELADPALRDRLLKEKNLFALTYTDPNQPLHEVDVLLSTPVAIELLLQRADKFDLDGQTVPVVAIKDLIELKEAAGRSQDHADVALLKKILGEGSE